MSLEKKIELLHKNFSQHATLEAKHLWIIEKGRSLPPLDPAHKTESNQIRGCQSRLFLHSWKDNEKVYFSAEADALISAGLAALLIEIYSGASPAEILKTPPTFLKEWGILTSLSPSRANGLSHLYLRMRSDALKFLV